MLPSKPIWIVNHKTGVDILKVMNENLFPSIGEMNSPSDWNKLPAYERHAPFIQREMELLKALRQAEPDAYLMLTVHGICASTIHWRPDMVMNLSENCLSDRCAATRTRCWKPGPASLMHLLN